MYEFCDMTGDSPDVVGYAAVADEYRAAGWMDVLPLPFGKQFPPPYGYTGGHAATPTDALIEEWKTANPRGNVALHIPDGVIGIDVDQYDHKRGGETLRRAEALWGALPATFRSSSRPAPSGIYFFRVPAGLHFPGKLEIDGLSDIEIIQSAHRYAVVFPSISPKTNKVYQWFAPNQSTPLDGIPTVDELPELPAAWLAGLKDQGGMVMGDGRAKVRMSAEVAAERLSAFTDGDMCPLVSARLTEALSSLEEPGNRHDAALLHTMALVGMGHDGHAGILSALESF